MASVLRSITMPLWGLRLLAFGVLFLVNALYASFSIVAQGVLGRIDPIVFTCLQMLLLVPFALWLVFWKRPLVDRAVVVRGMLLGVCLSSGFLCIALALRGGGITQTTVFTCLNGCIATLIAVFVLRQRVSRVGWLACLCFLIGAMLVWKNAATDWQSDLTAFVGGSLVTVYLFLVEHLLVGGQRRHLELVWPVLGVQFLAMAAVATLAALCFGYWQSLHALVPTDLAVFAYAGIGTILIPVVLETLMQRYVSAITVAYLAVLEPLLSLAFAFFMAGERLAQLSYVGVGIIVIGLVLQAAANAGVGPWCAIKRSGSWKPKATGGYIQMESPIPQAKRTRFPISLWVLFGGIFINRFGSFVGVFLILYLVAQGYSAAQAGIAAGAYGFGGMAASVIGGYLADRRGRRFTIVLSMFSSAVTMLALSQAKALPLVVGLAALAGLCAALYRPAASALLTDLVPQEQRVPAFAWYRFALNVGFAAGPLVAGFFASHSFFLLIFLADALSSIVFGLLALFALPKGAGVALAGKKSGEGGFVQAQRGDARFLLFLLGSLAVAAVYFQHESTLALQVHALGLSNAVYGALLSINGVVVIVCELPISHVTRKCPLLPLIAIGWLLTALGFGLVAFASTILLLAFTVVLWTVGEILHHPASAAYVADLAPAHLRGRYQGAWDLTWSIAQTIGPPLGALAFSWDAPRFWLLCGFLASVAALPLLLGKEQSEASNQAECSSEETTPLRESGLISFPSRGRSCLRGRRSRALLAYLGLFPQDAGMDIRALQRATGWSYSQVLHLVHALEKQGYIIQAAGSRRRYRLHPACRPAGALLQSA